MRGGKLNCCFWAVHLWGDVMQVGLSNEIAAHPMARTRRAHSRHARASLTQPSTSTTLAAIVACAWVERMGQVPRGHFSATARTRSRLWACHAIAWADAAVAGAFSCTWSSHAGGWAGPARTRRRARLLPTWHAECCSITDNCGSQARMCGLFRELTSSRLWFVCLSLLHNRFTRACSAFTAEQFRSRLKRAPVVCAAS